QRLALMDFLAGHGYNLYVYAPKDDPYHRERWREPYPPSQLNELRELAARARSVGVAFCFAVSPGLSLRYADDTELNRLWAKLEPLVQAGEGRGCRRNRKPRPPSGPGDRKST